MNHTIEKNEQLLQNIYIHISRIGLIFRAILFHSVTTLLDRWVIEFSQHSVYKVT
jgi:hypothetical protein